MSQIFVSYTGYDEETAYALTQWLSDQGWDDLHLSEAPTWKAMDKSEPPEFLEPAARRCEAVIFLITRDWLDSEWCKGQFSFFAELNKPMIGILLGDTNRSDVPGEFLGEWDLFDFSSFASPFSSKPKQSSGADTLSGIPLEDLLSNLSKCILSYARDPNQFQWPPTDDPDRQPYVGLTAYQKDDGGVFFGRDQLIGEAIDAVRELRGKGGYQVLLLTGNRAVGKSSLMHAGLLSRLALEPDRFLVLAPLEPATGVLHGHYGLFKSLNQTLTKLDLPDHPKRISAACEHTLAGEFTKHENLTSTPKGTNANLVDLLHEISRQSKSLFSKRPGSPSIILPIDQLGDILSQGDFTQNQNLKTILRAFSDQNDLSIIVVGTLLTNEVATLISALSPSPDRIAMVNVEELAPTAFREILLQPAERYSTGTKHIVLEDQLVARILEDVEQAQLSPVAAQVSLTMQCLFDMKQDDGSLTLESYLELGGIEGVLRTKNGDISPAASETNDVYDTAEVNKSQLLVSWIARYSPSAKCVIGQSIPTSKIQSQVKSAIEQLKSVRLLQESSLTTIADDGRTQFIEDTVQFPSSLLFGTWSPWEKSISNELPLLKTLGELADASLSWTINSRRADQIKHSQEPLIRLEAATHSEKLYNYFPQHQLEYVQTCRVNENKFLSDTVRLKSKFAKTMQATALACALIMLLAIGFGLDRSKETNIARAAMAVSSKKETAALKSLTHAENAQDTSELNLKLARSGERKLQMSLQERNTNVSKSLLATTELSKLIARPQLATNLLLEAASLSSSTEERKKLLPILAKRLTALQEKDRLLAGVDSEDQIETAIFSPDGSRFLTLFRDEPPKLWDSQTSVLLRVFVGHQSSVNSADFSPDGNKLITGSFDSTARLWDVKEGNELAVLSGHALSISFVAFSPDGKTAVTTSLDSTSIIWDLETTKIQHRLLGHNNNVNHAAYNPDSTMVVTSSNDARIWDVSTGELLAKLDGHSEGINSAEFSPNGRLLVTASNDHTAKVWDSASGKLIKELQTGGSPASKAIFQPNGKSIVTVSVNGEAALWSGKKLEEKIPLSGHKGNITSVAFNRKGNLVATGSSDKTARLWDSKSGKTLAVFDYHNEPVRTVQFNQNGNKLLTVADMVRIWGTATPTHDKKQTKSASVDLIIDHAQARQISSLTAAERKRYFIERNFQKNHEVTDNACDILGTDPLDLNAIGPPVSIEDLVTVSKMAIDKCKIESARRPNSPHFLHQIGRAYLSVANVGLATDYFQASARSGHAVAHFALGKISTQAGDYFAAIKSFSAAIEGGMGFAAHKAALMYWSGTGVPTRRTEAVRLWKAGSKLNDPNSHFELGRLYAVADQIPQNPIASQDLKVALHHFSEAARLFNEQGNINQAEVARNRRGTIARSLD